MAAEIEIDHVTKRYTILEDHEGVFGFPNVLFVVNTDMYEALGGQQFMDIVNAVSKLLTEPAMRAMNDAVLTDKKEPAEAAKEFLQANGLAELRRVRGARDHTRAPRRPPDSEMRNTV